MTDRRRLPRSLLWFGVTLVAILLQLSPVTGVFMMMLGGPWLSAVTLNAGIVSLAVEAWRGRASRGWLVAPVLWFGGYAAAAAFSHAGVRALERRVVRENAGKTVRWQDGDALVVDARGNSALHGVAGQLLLTYPLSVVYEVARRPRSADHLAYRLGGEETCRRLRENPKYLAAGIGWTDVQSEQWKVPDLCAYHVPENPGTPSLVVSASSERIETGFIPHTLVRVRIVDAAGRTTDLVGGHAAALAWFPLPLLGCGLNSGAPSWDCVATFLREDARLLDAQGAPPADGALDADGRSAMAVVARALALQPAPLAARRERITALGAPFLDAEGAASPATDLP